jgi:2-haloacid dehalogenase
MDELRTLPTSRRQLLTGLAVGLAGTTLAARPAIPLKAIAFDAFVLFDAATIVTRATEIVGDKASSLVAAASAKLFAYTWLYTSASRYAGFETLARDAFAFAAGANDLELSDRELDHLIEAYSTLAVFPDVPPALETLQRRGLRMAMLSNLPRQALDSSLRAGGIERYFQQVLSTDRVKKYKPAPEAYAMATSALGLGRESIGFAASAGWDAAGATWFGFPTVWVNRSHASAEPAHTPPQIVSNGIEGVLTLVR